MKVTNNDTLVFVYSSDATLKAAAVDFVTRLVAPDKYSCNLCMVTYGPVFQKQSWREFLDTLPNKKIFLHRDEFLKQYPEYRNVKLPAILTGSEGKLETFVSAEEINKIEDLEGLKKLITEKLHNEQK
ncbi:hypothetical protein IIA95_02815 [Patescibacteria group bacterium]|nr:hypothetical protein [Patescibacteria group bacterium]